MHDIGLIPTNIIRQLRDENSQENWKLRIKDAGEKAAATKRKIAVKEIRSEAGKKAWASRKSKVETTTFSATKTAPSAIVSEGSPAMPE